MPNLYERLENLLAALEDARTVASDVVTDPVDMSRIEAEISNAEGIAGEMKVMLNEQTKSTSISLVVVDNGDSDLEYWAFFDGDHAANFAALRGGDIEDITVLGEVDALEVIDNEENA